MREPIEILAIASEVPAARPATQAAVAAGIDVAFYHGWPSYCVAGDDQHPSDMASAALGRALAACGATAAELDLILYCGVSRDYLPSWSVATEIARRVGARCAGLDMTLGCLGLLMGIEVARGWLADPRRRLVAVVTAERWTYTIDHADVAVSALWGHSDGAAAVVVGSGPARGLARYHGASLVSLPEMNGFIRVDHGGTRQPIAPPGVSPFARTVRDDARAELFAKYMAALDRVIRQAAEDFALPIRRVVCGQVSPMLVAAVEQSFGLAPGSVPRTGQRFGHLGGADLAVGLEALVEEGARGPVIAASSCPYCMAAAALTLGPGPAEEASR